MPNIVSCSAFNFTAPAVMPDGSICNEFNLQQYAKGKYVVLVFYPLAFTFVCPTEIVAFSNRFSEFHKHGALVIGISVDSQFALNAWRNIPVQEGGIGEVVFPLVSDLNKSISRQYGVLMNDSIALRGTFIIDPDFAIQHMSVNNTSIGRNVDEFLRVILALQHYKAHGEVCPVNWSQGRDALLPTKDGISDYMTSNADVL